MPADPTFSRAARFKCCIPDCRADTRSEFHDVCTKHFIRIGLDFVAETKDRFGYPLAHEWPERRQVEKRQPVVYYLRMGDHVKIGTTIDLRGRLSALYVEEAAVLATEPGGYDVERERHRQFAPERISKRRELFNPSPRLLAHIERLQET